MVFRNFQGYTASVFRIKLPDNVRDYQTGTSYNGDNLVNPTNHRTTYGGWTDWLPYPTGVELKCLTFVQLQVLDIESNTSGDKNLEF